ncbi:reverse transcriptase domain-containing protein [Tanacetum coccineum]
MGVENLQANVDLRLVANQVNGTYVTKETDMIRYLEKVKTLTSSFKAFSIKQVPRNENKKADVLSKIASTSFAHLSKQVLVEELKEKSISAAEVLAVVEEEGDTWMTPIFKYLTDGTLPAEGKKARAVKCKSWRTTPDQLCSKRDTWGIFTHARSTTSVVQKALRIGFSAAQPCIGRKKKLIHASRLPSSHPVPRNPQHNSKEINSRLCEKLCIRQQFTSVSSTTAHYWPSGRRNRSLGEGIKARLDERSKNWMEEFPHVLWAHRIMIKSSNGDTPFSLTYETEAVILAEIGMPTLRTKEVNLKENKEALEINLDLLEERREQAAIR